MASANQVSNGYFYQQAESIEVIIRDAFFDNDDTYFSGDVCFTNTLQLEVKITLTQTSSMASDGDYDRAYDTRDAYSDQPSYFKNIREVYCGLPILNENKEIVDYEKGFVVTFSETGASNFIWEVEESWFDYLDYPNLYDDSLDL